MDEKTRRIWAGLVNYVNGTATVSEIRATIADCTGLVAATMISDIFDADFMHDDLSKQVEAYRSPIDNLLRFLCSEPKSEERHGLRAASLEFLDQHREHISGLVFKEVSYYEQNVRNLNYGPEELEYFKRRITRMFDQERYSLPLGLLVPSKGYRDLADPICDFLCSEYDRYLNKEVSRKDKKIAPLTPIFVCPHCNKLVMPERIGQKHFCSVCSERARAEKYRQKASPDEGRDYAWLYRLRDPDTRKIRLRQPKVKQRLAEIKLRQKNSPRCQGLLQDLRL